MLEFRQPNQNEGDNLREDLKRDTRKLHDRLEAMWTREDKFASHGHYIAFLKAILEAHVTVGVAAAQRTGVGGAVALEHDRIAALCDDLGCGPRVPNTAQDLAFGYAWGVGYVLNGSTIGAASIMKSGFLEPGWPRCYMALGQSYAKAGGVAAYFEQLDTLEADRGSVLQGALETFALFERSDV